MTDIIEEIVESETFDLNDLDHFWMENGLPVFMATHPNICDIVESMGFQIYYILTNNVKQTTSQTTNPQTKVTTTNSVNTSVMQLFKVVNNFVGRTVSASNDPFDGNFVQMREEALYTMPPIPHVIVEKLDQFFRLVDAQHGTESIVMLTYDITKEGSEGWGILVPDQTNTSVHCNYDPDSIASIKPDDVMIVGSVHSHPGMSAYASGTDHKDQADFDGLHITYGWQKTVNNGATQYHIEMQMAGKAYTLTPEDVFEDIYVDKTPDPEVVEWTNKVKKVLPPKAGGTNMVPTSHTSQTGVPHRQQATAHGTKTKNHDGIEIAKSRFLYANNLKIEEDAIVVAEIDNANKTFFKCPTCKVTLDDFNLYNGYCDECYLPICGKNTSVGSIIINLADYCKDMIIDSNVPVYLWSIDEDGTESLMKIVETTLAAYIDDEYDNYYNSSKYSETMDAINVPSNSILSTDDSHEFTYCCGTSISNIEDCRCDLQITSTDVQVFDTLTKSINMYSRESRCSECEYFYDYKCPAWNQHLMNYIESGNVVLNLLEGVITDEGCGSFEPYMRVPLEEYYYD